jgi:signal transduction histidine kinase/DNA-binding response OmpR family regulator
VTDEVGVDIETTALRLELDETNRGLLALHAELSHHQQQLEQARAVAEEAGRAKAVFLANMSHEIRSPMNAVVGFTGLILETELTPEQLEYAHAVQAAGRHLLGVIDDILDLSKIESGRLEIEDISFDLYACVEDAVGILALKAAEKQLSLAALFASDTPAVVRGDPLRLGQILVNLLANAIKFTACGQVTVDVSYQHAAQRLTVRVNDTGTGIPAEIIGRLFTPFTQADASTTRFHGGTGLGLSICRQLAEQMGGTITVESTVDRGSTFTCTIETRVGTANATASDYGLLAGSRVLVIHRHDVVIEAIRRHLASWGAEVVTASNIDGGVNHPEWWPPVDLVLVDADDDDDATFARDLTRLADAHRRPPIIAITALAGRHPGAHAGQVSVSAPVRRAYLREAVLAALGHTDPVRAADPIRALTETAERVDRTISITNAAAEPPLASTLDTHRPSCRVVYVDDDPMMVTLVTRILGREPGVVLHTASDGETALRLAADHQPHLILLDLNLTDSAGDDVLRQLQTDIRTSQIPVVMVSGDAAPDTIERLVLLGAAGYLTKPFQPAQLRELIRDAAARAGRRDG